LFSIDGKCVNKRDPEIVALSKYCQRTLKESPVENMIWRRRRKVSKIGWFTF
jgi:hypothetical protein